MPEYTGNLLLNFDKNATAKTAEEVEAALPTALPADLKVLKASPASDQDVYVVTKEFSEQKGVKSLADLSKITEGVAIGGFSELEKRAYGPDGLKKIYNVKVTKFSPLDSPEVMASELKDEQHPGGGHVHHGECHPAQRTDRARGSGGNDPAAERDPAGPLGGR